MFDDVPDDPENDITEELCPDCGESVEECDCECPDCGELDCDGECCDDDDGDVYDGDGNLIIFDDEEDDGEDD